MRIVFDFLQLPGKWERFLLSGLRFLFTTVCKVSSLRPNTRENSASPHGKASGPRGSKHTRGKERGGTEGVFRLWSHNDLG